MTATTIERQVTETEEVEVYQCDSCGQCSAESDDFHLMYEHTETWEALPGYLQGEELANPFAIDALTKRTLVHVCNPCYETHYGSPDNPEDPMITRLDGNEYESPPTLSDQLLGFVGAEVKPILAVGYLTSMVIYPVLVPFMLYCGYKSEFVDTSTSWEFIFALLAIWIVCVVMFVAANV